MPIADDGRIRGRCDTQGEVERIETEEGGPRVAVHAAAPVRPGDAVVGTTGDVALRPRRIVAVGAIAIGACALAVVAFGIEARDDAYITYWVAEQLAKTGRLVNVNGSHVEQSSSLALVLVLAALFTVTRLPLPVLGYVVGLASLGVTVWLAAGLARRVRPEAELPAALVVAVAFPLLFWSTGGLETLLASAGVLWYLGCLERVLATSALTRRAVVAYVASTLLVVAVRPDTMIIVGVLALVVLAAAELLLRLRWLGRRAPSVPRRRAWLATGGVLSSVVLLALVRLALFGAVLPRPDLAKLGGVGWLSTGFSYVFSSLPYWLWLPCLALTALGIAWSGRNRSLPGLLAGATFVGGVIGVFFSRGDWMGGARLLVPYLAPGLVVMVVGAWSLVRAWRRAALCALLAAECVALVLFANGAGWVSSAFANEFGATLGGADEAVVGSPFGATVSSLTGRVPPLPWYASWDYVAARDAVFLAAATPVLRRYLDADPTATVTISSSQAGMVIDTWERDFPGRLRFLDMDSVATDALASCPGVRPSYAGDVLTLARWIRDGRRCGPPLPDLVFFLGLPSATPALAGAYHVVSLSSIVFRQRHTFGAASLLGASEFLAARDGWPSPAPRAPSRSRAP
jgi:hypothetical protein